MLLGGLHKEYRDMYEAAIATAKQHNFFRPLNKDNLDILVSGLVKVYEGRVELVPEGQHLVCFAGGMIGIASQIFGLNDLSTARKLVDGCIWSYASTPAKIMPETFRLISCKGDCMWSEAEWRKEVLNYQTEYGDSANDIAQERRLPPGFTDVMDRSYILRHVFVRNPSRFMTDDSPDQKLSSLFSFYTASLVTRPCRTRLGTCSRPSKNTREQTSHTPP